jgi:hypothetical protein
MTDQEFFMLCTATSRELGLDDVDVLAEEGEITLEGVRIGLYFTAQTDEFISCFVDIGFIDEAIRQDAFSHVLGVNLEINGVNGEALGFDAETGHLVLRASINPDLACNARLLTEWLLDYAEFAVNLRTMIASFNKQDTDSSYLLGTLA